MSLSSSLMVLGRPNLMPAVFALFDLLQFVFQLVILPSC